MPRRAALGRRGGPARPAESDTCGAARSLVVVPLFAKVANRRDFLGQAQSPSPLSSLLVVL